MPDVFVMGDSHAGTLKRGFAARGWTTHGGTIQTGRKFEGPFVEIVDGEVKFALPRTQDNFERSLKSAGVKRITDLKIPIVTTIGFNTHRFMKEMIGLTVLPDADDRQYISSAVLEAMVLENRAAAFSLYDLIRDNDVFAIHSPQRARPDPFDMLLAGDTIFANGLRARGIDVVDVRDRTLDQNAKLRQEYWSDTVGDNAHANDLYAGVVLDEIITRLEARNREQVAAE